MYNVYNPYPYPYPYPYPCPCYGNVPMYNPYNMQSSYHPYYYWNNPPLPQPHSPKELIELKDYGPEPFVVNLDEATKQNHYFRLALWTGHHLQLTLMSIGVGEEIGLEMHPHVDQFLSIVEGQGLVKMGDKKNHLDFQKRVHEGYAIFVPAGKWHNLINTGHTPLKLYSIYAPPEHPHGTVHKTKEDAEDCNKPNRYEEAAY